MTATRSDPASTPPSPPSAPALPVFARGPVLTVAAAVGLLLTAVSGRYGYSGAVLYVGDPPPALRAAFGSARQVRVLDNDQRA